MSDRYARLEGLVRNLYAITDEMQSLFAGEGRSFTPDGHLVGSIGDVIAAKRYGLRLVSESAKDHDAVATDGRRVEIKTTQRKSVALRAQPDHLLVMLLDPTGSLVEIYNGPGSLVWSNCGPPQARNGQRQIGLGKLRALMAGLPRSASLELVASD